jgi:hypothetical protein
MPQSRTATRSERRGNARADANLSMRLMSGPGSDGQPEFVTESENISASGVYCFSPHYLAPLSKVGLTLVLPDGGAEDPRNRLLKCEAVVVRCEQQARAARGRQFELACSFLGLDDDRRRLLDEFVTLRNLRALGAAAPAARRRATARARAVAGGKKRTVKAKPRVNGAAGRARAAVVVKRKTATKPAARAATKRSTSRSARGRSR